MHYELWGISTGNRIAILRTEVEAFALVRELLDDGWEPEELALAAFPDAGFGAKPRAVPLEGEELRARAYAGS